ncbi:serine kinase [Pokkaliibacter sp. MBI-7]|uniref:Serine kinase n=1 Tax=Proteobacteria bacterium 228 TaxID=2083153 RepID=A0A2S5KQR0_9PROT|nr:MULTISPECIES: serine kinase [Pokkaliibacter]MDH2435680.1 serine kinase [Pokkaliibacter sp. MBI-7]PPC77022.1 serine kinase [Pokkaliibacter plantistimulans]
MSSVDSVRHRLDTQFERSQKNMDDIATNLDGASLDDIYAFNSAMRQNATASWAVNQELQVKHSLAKAIINEIR